MENRQSKQVDVDIRGSVHTATATPITYPSGAPGWCIELGNFVLWGPNALWLCITRTSERLGFRADGTGKSVEQIINGN